MNLYTALRWSVLLSSLAGTPVHSSTWALRLGPSSTGGGGSNPLAIPPVNPLDYEFELRSDSGATLTVSVLPGLFAGQTYFVKDDFAISVGGGLLASTLGSGPGATYGLSYLAPAKQYGFEIGVRQSLGLVDGHLVSIYSVRLGVGWKR